MKLEDFVHFHNDILQFDPSSPIAVQWSPTNGLIYRQLGKVQAFPYLDNYFFPPKNLKLGVLIPYDLEELKKSLTLIIQDPALSSNSLNSIIENCEFKIYKLFSGLYGPQLAYDLKFVTFTNTLISKYVLYTSDLNSKLLVKAINNENRQRRNRKSSTD